MPSPNDDINLDDYLKSANKPNPQMVQPPKVKSSSASQVRHPLDDIPIDEYLNSVKSQIKNPNETAGSSVPELGSAGIRTGFGMAGNIGGDILGAPLGPVGSIGLGALGQFGGQYLGQGLQTLAPKVFGEPAKSNWDPAVEAGTQEIIGGLTKFGGKLFTNYLKSLKPTAEGFPIAQALSGATEPLESTILNASEAAQKIEKGINWGKTTREDILRKDLREPINLPNTTAYVQKNLQNIRDSLIPNSRILNSEDRQIIDQLSSLGLENPKPELTNAPFDYATKRFNPRSGYDIQNLSGNAKSPSASLNFDQAINLKQRLGERLTKLDPSSREAQVLSGFTKTYGEELNSYMEKTLSPQHYQMWHNLQDKYIQASNTLDNPTAQKLLSLGVDPKVTYETIAKDAFSSPDAMRRFITVTGDKDVLGGVAIKRVMDKATDNANRTFDAKLALNELQTNRDLYSEAMPKDVFNNYQQLLTNLSNSQASNARFKITPWKGGLTLLGIGQLLGMHGMHMAETGLASTIGLHLSESAMTKALENPTFLRALAEGSKMDLNSKGASTLNKVLIKGLRGVSGLSISYLDQPDINIPVDSDGNKLVPTK